MLLSFILLPLIVLCHLPSFFTRIGPSLHPCTLPCPTLTVGQLLAEGNQQRHQHVGRHAPGAEELQREGDNMSFVLREPKIRPALGSRLKFSGRKLDAEET